MGMFDTVHMQCPNCNKQTSEQTKAGECLLRDYKLNEEAHTTLAMQGKHYCEHCEKPFIVEIQSRPIAFARIVYDHEKMEL